MAAVGSAGCGRRTFTVPAISGTRRTLARFLPVLVRSGDQVHSRRGELAHGGPAEVGVGDDPCDLDEREHREPGSRADLLGGRCPPTLMAANLARLEEAAWPIFRAGHVPMIGEWVALPVLRSAGAGGVTDPLAEQVMYPTAQRLLQHCDAVLRLPGESAGADQDVAIARERGIPV
jgi:hypothetical protein